MPPVLLLPLLLVVGVIAAAIDRTGSPLEGYLFGAIASAALALLGLMLILGDGGWPRKIAIAAAGVVGFGVLFWVRPPFNEWELLLAFERFIVVALGLLAIGAGQGLQFTNRDSETSSAAPPLKIGHLLIFLTAIGMFLGLVRIIKHSNSGSDLLLLTFMATVGAFASLASLLAALGALTQRTIMGAVPFVLAVLSVAACVGYFTFTQTDSYVLSMKWVLASTVESAFVAAALSIMRLRGYRLTTAACQSVTTSTETEPPLAVSSGQD